MARQYLTDVGMGDPDANASTAELIWMHALAIGYAPAFTAENGNAIRRDWPRIPLPKSKAILLASADLGRQIAGLLDVDAPVKDVTTGSIGADLKTIGVMSRVGGGQLNPDGGDLEVTSGWGHFGSKGIVMPGAGQIVKRQRTPIEVSSMLQGLEVRGGEPGPALALLGQTTYDVYLNETAFWKNVPLGAWKFTLGGYQVLKSG
jgi:hypothetical protein